MHDTAMNGSVLRATVVSKLTRLYPFLTGCGTVANHPLVDALAGQPKSDTWAAVEGGRLSVSLADHVGRAAFYVGDLDRKVSALIDRFVKPGDTVLDIGANIGLVAFRLSKRVGPGGKVHAFEPNSAVADRFGRSLDANAISNVEIHRIALGSEPGTQPLSIPSGNAGAASLVSGRVEGKTADVRVERLDDLNLGPVSFVKMDVEGFEEQVLRGYARTLRSAPPQVILFEQNDESGSSIQLLIEAGYTIHGIAKSFCRLSLKPVSSWSPLYNDYLATRPRPIP